MSRHGYIKSTSEVRERETVFVVSLNQMCVQQLSLSITIPVRRYVDDKNTDKKLNVLNTQQL